MTGTPLQDAKRKHRSALTLVAITATDAEEARRDLERAVRNAALHNGANVRELATASGLAERQVRRIVNAGRGRRMVVRMRR